MSLKKILFIPDTHIPYHDRKAYSLVLRVAKTFRPEILVLGGDFGEFYCTNGHRKDPNRNRFLDWEIESINTELDALDALGAKRKIYIEGNHEENLRRYLADRCPELFNTIKIEELLQLRKRGWEFYPYKKKKAHIGKLAITHDLGNAGRNAVDRALDGYQGNIIINHTHRLKYMVEGNYQGVKHVSACFGWLGDVSHIDYMDQEKARKEWALGFGTGYLAPNGTVHAVPIPIVNYTCVVEGKLYRI